MTVLTRLLHVSWIILAAAVLSSCRALQFPEPKSTRSDQWHKIKECTAQVEKMRGQHNNAQNHYSPKYDKCFVRVVEAGGFFEKSASTLLLDAFEGSIRAISAFTGPCYVGGKEADCAKAEEFIADAMTN